jgi:hypothetical protein
VNRDRREETEERTQFLALIGSFHGMLKKEALLLSHPIV